MTGYGGPGARPRRASPYSRIGGRSLRLHGGTRATASRHRGKPREDLAAAGGVRRVAVHGTPLRCHPVRGAVCNGAPQTRGRGTPPVSDPVAVRCEESVLRPAGSPVAELDL